MNAVVPLRGFFSRHARWIVSLGILAILLAALPISIHFIRQHLERDWTAIQQNEESRLASDLQSAFSSYQSSTIASVKRVASLGSVQRALTQPQDSVTGAAIEALLEAGEKDFSLELYDRHLRLAGWAGTRGPAVDQRVLEAADTSFVLQGPLYSTFVAAVPVTSPEGTIGVLVGKRLFDVNYPINNRFVSNAAFTSTFTASLDIAVDFDFTGAPPVPSSGSFIVPLHRAGASVIGFALLKRPMLGARLDALDLTEGHIARMLMLAAAIVLAFAGFGAARSIRSLLLRGIVFTVGIWMLRYILIWTDFPLSIVHWDIFGPADFASPLADGIAKSLGDVCLSSLALFINILILDCFVAKGRREAPQDSPPRSLTLLALPVVLLLVFVVLLCIRGFAAVVHSAVYDSALAYNDPTSVIPSFRLSLMLGALTLIALSLIIAAVEIIGYCRRRLEMLPSLSGRPGASWAILTGIVLGGSILFGLAQPTPLMSQSARAITLAAFLVMAGWVERRKLAGGILSDSRLAIAGGLIALLVVIGLLDQTAHELDRTHVELMASEIVRPEDSWLTLLVNQTLDEMSGDDAARTLAAGDSDDVQKLAFTQWARSILSKEGNNCSVAYTSPDGVIVSDFHIGIAPRPLQERRIGIAPRARNVHTEEKNQNGAVVKWCIGYAPIAVDSNAPVGGVWVEISGGRQTILRGEAPEILRNYTREKFETHFRTFILSEYFQGRLIFTTAENVPLDRRLPPEVRKLAENGTGFWWDDEIDGKHYETYSMPERSGDGSGAWIALGMETLGLRWHLYSFLRYLVFYSLLGVAAFVLAWGIRLLRGERIIPSFRTRLMAAFIAVSVIPVIVLALYNRQYANERGRDATAKRLSDQTSVVVAEVQRELGANVPAALAALTDDRCVEIANDLNTDFNVYFGSMLQASSKPEMFTAEILDPRVSADAYLNIVVRKKEFFSDNQSIGKFPYVVGYRPLDAENDSVIGVVSVPTLYRQSEIDEDLARRNVFLYGAYAIAAALSVIIGTLVANQISAPVRRLKRATEQIAGGRLDVDLRGARTDELGELEEAFKRMTLDLRRTQEEMVRTQRELAWKEMAQQVAHEIKNPLTPIKLSIQHLRQAYTDGVRDFGGILKQVSETILGQIDALSRIASEFSHFARMPERRLEACDLHQVITEARNLFLQHKGIRFTMRLARHALFVTADREELRRAFINILRNAVQAMEEKGTITVETSAADGLARITISDTGPGIRPEVRARLFEPNFSTKTDGMGLGLAIVRNTIVDLGGTVTLSSEEGKGTAVRITLPLAPADGGPGGGS